MNISIKDGWSNSRFNNTAWVQITNWEISRKMRFCVAFISIFFYNEKCCWCHNPGSLEQYLQFTQKYEIFSKISTLITLFYFFQFQLTIRWTRTALQQWPLHEAASNCARTDDEHFSSSRPWILMFITGKCPINLPSHWHCPAAFATIKQNDRWFVELYNFRKSYHPPRNAS